MTPKRSINTINSALCGIYYTAVLRRGQAELADANPGEMIGGVKAEKGAGKNSWEGS